MSAERPTVCTLCRNAPAILWTLAAMPYCARCAAKVDSQRAELGMSSLVWRANEAFDPNEDVVG